jgi:hypothetical protein
MISYDHPGDEIPRDRYGYVCDVVIVENRQIGSRRWESDHELVIRTPNGKLWRAYYSLGLTECQMTEAFEDDDTVEFTEVTAHPLPYYSYCEAG